MNIIESIEHVVTKYHNIGIFVSGGLDSTVLSKLVLDTRHKLNTDNNITFFTVPRTDASFAHATRVVKYLMNDPTLNVVGNPTLHHSIQVLSGIQQVLRDPNIDIDMYLLGDTTNPSHLHNGPERHRSDSTRVFQPFFDYTKDIVVKLAIDLGYTDIFNISHTCTESKLLRCNMCWQCRERAWAFKTVNYTDTGTM